MVFLFKVVVSFCFLFVLPLQAQEQRWDDIYKKAKPAIPFVFSSGGLCSGALIKSNLVLTAKHCVSKQRDIWISWPDAPSKWEKAKLLFMHPSLDFAFIELEKAKSDKTPLPLKKTGSLGEGSPAATIGHPTRNTISTNPPFSLDLSHVFSAGHISKKTKEEVVFDLSISPGNSGGPVFDKEGQIIGVVSRKLIQQFVGNIGYAVSYEPINEALSQKERTPLESPTWLDTPTELGFNILFNWEGYQDTLSNNTSNYRTSFNLQWLFADRLLLNYTNNFGLNNVNFESYGLGYKLQTDLPSNKIPVWIAPGFEGLEYKPKNIQSAKTYYARSLYVDFGMQNLPISLRVGRVMAKNSQHWLFAIKLGN